MRNIVFEFCTKKGKVKNTSQPIANETILTIRRIKVLYSYYFNYHLVFILIHGFYANHGSIKLSIRMF